MKGSTMKVQNMTGNSGREIANQFVIQEGDIEYFQSYNSIIVKVDRSDYPAKVYLDKTYWDYSRTTGKYRNKFLGIDKRETEQRIKDGRFILADLNPGA